MLSVFLAHSAADNALARELRAFLEVGCDASCIVSNAMIEPGQDLLSTAEMGRAADVVVLLLSPASNLPRWRREVWEPMFDRASQAAAPIAILLVEECVFPGLLRRGSNFFNTSPDRLAAMRHLKRWLWGVRLGTSPAMIFSSDLETLYRSLADSIGMVTASGTLAERFAHQAARDFENVFWIPAHGRTFTQIAGDLGFQMGIPHDGPLEENCRHIRDALSRKRYLVVFDAPQVGVDAILPSGRSSILFTDKPVHIANDRVSLTAARELVSAGRLAEAYEILYPLLNAGVEPESCARELVWICDRWDRVDEANALRFQFRPFPSEQLRLF